jgi:hypothetical protein
MCRGDQSSHDEVEALLERLGAPEVGEEQVLEEVRELAVRDEQRKDDDPVVRVAGKEVSDLFSDPVGAHRTRREDDRDVAAAPNRRRYPLQQAVSEEQGRLVDEAANFQPGESVGDTLDDPAIGVHVTEEDLRGSFGPCARCS